MRWYSSGSCEDRVKQLGRSQPGISEEQAVAYSQICLEKSNAIQPQREERFRKAVCFSKIPIFKLKTEGLHRWTSSSWQNPDIERKCTRGGTRHGGARRNASWRVGLRKTKIHLELNLLRYVKGIRKGFYRYLGSKRKTGENVGQLLNSPGNLVIKNMEKAKVPSAFFTYIFTHELMAIY